MNTPTVLTALSLVITTGTMSNRQARGKELMRQMGFALENTLTEHPEYLDDGAAFEIHVVVDKEFSEAKATLHAVWPGGVKA